MFESSYIRFPVSSYSGSDGAKLALKPNTRVLYSFQRAGAQKPTHSIRYPERFLECDLSKVISQVYFQTKNPIMKGFSNSKIKTTEANQALETTTMSVTDRAFARSAPATVVSHL